jgi:hypothetical protein
VAKKPEKAPIELEKRLKTRENVAKTKKMKHPVFYRGAAGFKRDL